MSCFKSHRIVDNNWFKKPYGTVVSYYWSTAHTVYYSNVQHILQKIENKSMKHYVRQIVVQPLHGTSIKSKTVQHTHIYREKNSTNNNLENITLHSHNFFKDVECTFSFFSTVTDVVCVYAWYCESSISSEGTFSVQMCSLHCTPHIENHLHLCFQHR